MDKLTIVGYIALIVIIISLGNIGMKLTGYATDTAKLNLTVRSLARVNFTTDSINFGAGVVQEGNVSATMTSNGTMIGGNWTTVTDEFTLENTGNKNATITIKTGKTNATLLGGTDPVYQWAFHNTSEVGSCNNSKVVVAKHGAWNLYNTTGVGTLICDPLFVDNDKDVVQIEVKLVVPSDSFIGNLSDIFTATATAV